MTTASGRGTSLTDVADDWPTLAETLRVMTFNGGFNTNVVVLATTMLGIAAGIVGVFALLRKRSLMGDALAHATLPGIAVAFIVAFALGWQGRSLPVLMVGATVSGVVGVLCVQWLLRVPRVHEDAAIGIVLSVFFGVGVVLLSVIQKLPNANAGGIDTFIYGQTAAMAPADSYLMAAVAMIAVLAAALLLKEMAIVCFNDGFARVDGWPVGLIDLLMMALVVIVTVAGLQAVGLILVIALLIIPAVSARFWTERLWLLVIVAGCIGGMSGYLGSVTSALLPRKPAGAVIVLVAGGLFLVSMFVAPRRGVLASLLRRLRLRVKIAVDHVTEFAAERGGHLDVDAVRRLGELRGWGMVLRWWLPGHLRRLGLATTVDGIRLTNAGKDRGKRVARNHRLWERYLVTHADIAPSHIDWTVDEVEHVLDADVIERLERETEAANGKAVPA
ncbi:MAG: iron chelate uptake ABC transporter family permease subunit [Planctomycetota bacterium]